MAAQNTNLSTSETQPFNQPHIPGTIALIPQHIVARLSPINLIPNKCSDHEVLALAVNFELFAILATWFAQELTQKAFVPELTRKDEEPGDDTKAFANALYALECCTNGRNLVHQAFSRPLTFPNLHDDLLTAYDTSQDALSWLCSYFFGDQFAHFFDSSSVSNEKNWHKWGKSGA